MIVGGLLGLSVPGLPPLWPGGRGCPNRIPRPREEEANCGWDVTLSSEEPQTEARGSCNLHPSWEKDSGLRNQFVIWIRGVPATCANGRWLQGHFQELCGLMGSATHSGLSHQFQARGYLRLSDSSQGEPGGGGGVRVLLMSEALAVGCGT